MIITEPIIQNASHLDFLVSIFLYGNILKTNAHHKHKSKYSTNNSIHKYDELLFGTLFV